MRPALSSGSAGGGSGDEENAGVKEAIAERRILAVAAEGAAFDADRFPGPATSEREAGAGGVNPIRQSEKFNDFRGHSGGTKTRR